MSDKDFQTRRTKDFKLKDKPPQRRFVKIHLKKVFGFVPEHILIEKKPRQNNRIYVHAVLTPEELKKEAEAKKDKEIKEEVKKIKNGEKKED